MSKKESKVSVIVPIYNRESLMQKCVDSILNQTYKNIEVLLVDDHSSDNSYKVMKEYTKKDSRVKAYTYKENKGAGHARNVGLDNATGDYIIFVDSDDYIDNDYVETLVNHIGDADMICCGHRVINENNKIVRKNKVKNNSFGCFRYPVIWGRMYTLSSINENNIRFSYIKTSQDVRFIFEYVVNVCNTKVIDYYGYNYVENNKDRITNNHKIQKTRNLNETLFNIDVVLKNKNAKILYKDEIYYFIMKELIYSVRKKSKLVEYDNLEKYYDECICFINNNFINNGFKIKFIKKFDTYTNFIIINLFVLCYKLNLKSLVLKLIRIS